MIYECLTKNGKFIVAKPQGWTWSAREKTEFEVICVDVDLNSLTPEINVAGQQVPIELFGLSVEVV
jgi:hypothetical protein